MRRKKKKVSLKDKINAIVRSTRGLPIQKVT